MLTSILVPVRNGEAFLRQALDSVVSAAGPEPYEIVVQDSVSTDDTQAIVQSCDANILYVCEPDVGQADGLNRGLMRASGEVIGWLNSDDLYRPGAIASAVSAFRADASVDVVYGDFQVFDESYRMIRDYHSSPWSWKRLYLKGNYIFSGATFFRRSVFERFGMFSTEYHYVLDLEFFLRIGAGVRAVHINETYGAFRWHSSSKSLTRRFEFCREAARVRRSYLAAHGIGRGTYARAQVEHWLAAATAPVRFSPLYSKLRPGKTL